MLIMKVLFLFSRSILVTILLVFFSNISAQTLPQKLIERIDMYHVKPLKEVDTINNNISNDVHFDNGWHVVYYVNVGHGDGIQLNLYTFIYNDSICHTFFKPTNFERVDYDSLVFVREDSAFLYLKYADNNNSLEILSTTDDHEFYSLYALVYQDYNQGIYVMSPSGFCGGREIDPFFYVTSLTAHETKEVAFKGKWKQDSSTNSGLQINAQQSVVEITIPIRRKLRLKSRNVTKITRFNVT